MFIRYASAKIEHVAEHLAPFPGEVTAASDGSMRIGSFEVTPRTDSDYLYVSARACTADVPNRNFDMLPSYELAPKPNGRGAYESFKGACVFLNHDNQDPAKARGAVIDARWHDEDPDDKWVEALLELDEKRCPKLCEYIRNGDIDTFSMGCTVASAKCSVCGKVVEEPWQNCVHLDNKGRRFGDKLAYDICEGINFFELSAVFDPADETARTLATAEPKSGERYGGATKDGKPRSDFAYTPTDDPSTWKLDISDKDHAAAAKAALGAGFRGERVEIPDKDRKAVIERVNAACRKFGIDEFRGGMVIYKNPVTASFHGTTTDTGRMGSLVRKAMSVVAACAAHRDGTPIDDIYDTALSCLEEVTAMTSEGGNFALDPRIPSSDDVAKHVEIRCPLCGSPSFDGVNCPTCGYMAPPEGMGEIDIDDGPDGTPGTKDDPEPLDDSTKRVRDDDCEEGVPMSMRPYNRLAADERWVDIGHGCTSADFGHFTATVEEEDDGTFTVFIDPSHPIDEFEWKNAHVPYGTYFSYEEDNYESRGEAQSRAEEVSRDLDTKYFSDPKHDRYETEGRPADRKRKDDNEGSGGDGGVDQGKGDGDTVKDDDAQRTSAAKAKEPKKVSAPRRKDLSQEPADPAAKDHLPNGGSAPDRDVPRSPITWGREVVFSDAWTLTGRSAKGTVVELYCDLLQSDARIYISLTGREFIDSVDVCDDGNFNAAFAKALVEAKQLAGAYVDLIDRSKSLNHDDFKRGDRTAASDDAYDDYDDNQTVESADGDGILNDARSLMSGGEDPTYVVDKYVNDPQSLAELAKRYDAFSDESVKNAIRNAIQDRFMGDVRQADDDTPQQDQSGDYDVSADPDSGAEDAEWMQDDQYVGSSFRPILTDKNGNVMAFLEVRPSSSKEGAYDVDVLYGTQPSFLQQNGEFGLDRWAAAHFDSPDEAMNRADRCVGAFLRSLR